MNIKQAKALHPGDEVTWNDPDDGACTCTFTILEIHHHCDDIFKITKMDGGYIEVLASELSPNSPMKFQLITIENRSTDNEVFHGLDRDALRLQVATYCRENWPHEMTDDNAERMPEDDDELIAQYFNEHDREFLIEQEFEIQLPQPFASANELLTALKNLIGGAEEGLRNCESDANDGVEGAQESYDEQQAALVTAQDLIDRLETV